MFDLIVPGHTYESYFYNIFFTYRQVVVSKIVYVHNHAGK
jgi:hypothetical protein